MKKIICVLLLICVCFLLVACGQTNEENYGEIQYKTQCKIFFGQVINSLETYVNNWISENPEVIIENVVYGNSGSYTISHYIIVFYRVPIG